MSQLRPSVSVIGGFKPASAALSASEKAALLADLEAEEAAELAKAASGGGKSFTAAAFAKLRGAPVPGPRAPCSGFVKASEVKHSATQQSVVKPALKSPPLARKHVDSVSPAAITSPTHDVAKRKAARKDTLHVTAAVLSGDVVDACDDTAAVTLTVDEERATPSAALRDMRQQGLHR